MKKNATNLSCKREKLSTLMINNSVINIYIHRSFDHYFLTTSVHVVRDTWTHDAILFLQ